MTFIKKLAIISLLALFAPAAFATEEDTAAKQVDMVIGLPQRSNSRPIMIIRFNKMHVYYKAPLKRLLEEVQDIRPTISYDVVSLIPPVEDKRAGQNLAEFNGNKIVEAMVADGINREHIHLVVQDDASVKTNEIHLLAF